MDLSINEYQPYKKGCNPFLKLFRPIATVLLLDFIVNGALLIEVNNQSIKGKTLVGNISDELTVDLLLTKGSVNACQC